jgi:hypothetical protein
MDRRITLQKFDSPMTAQMALKLFVKLPFDSPDATTSTQPQPPSNILPLDYFLAF